MLKNILVAVLIFLLLPAAAAHASHPLITDDYETQGKGKSELEFIGDYTIDKHESATEKRLTVPTIPFLSYGIGDKTDLVLGFPYEMVTTENEAGRTTVHGITDASIEVKARFYEKEGLYLAVKPGITFPTGKEGKGLGNGKVSYSVFLIATKEAEPWAVHVNIGYIRNQFKLQVDEDDNTKDIWHVSLAAEVEVVKKWKPVANIAIQRNPERSSSSPSVFILGGIIYSITERLDADLGLKYGAHEPGTDVSYLAGLTWKLE
jgi:hypothetical protein